ncbi:thiol reductant ABC exporter subunit CydC [Rarobacter faecitabidus]|uniref:ATP-binding cassette subfamily C protein CydC n=2 Tax=Rarobacter faecitabidus TaxID=13243 RepID=A0A542ZUS5_RARFA|nr:ATP-binding cassette subfamily C protein CydC [Rarobacter faecitabidus]
MRALAVIDLRWSKVARAILLGTGALGSAVALGAASAWLIARASQMPPVLTLSVVVVSVRAFGISRGVFRYLERLASHQVALGTMGDLRTALYQRLSGGPVGAVTALRRGDLLARVGADVDHVGDVVVRGIIPAGISAAVSLLTVIGIGLLLPEAALFLAIGLAIAGILAPSLTARGARDAERDGARARADVTARALDLIEHSPQIIVAGRFGDQLAALTAADRSWQASTRRGAQSLGAGAAAGMAGLAIAVIGALLTGIPAVQSGRLSEVALAVVVLTPLAAFESTTVLPAAAIQFYRSTVAAGRLMELWDQVGGDGERALARAEVTDPALALELDDVVIGWPSSGMRARVGSLQVQRGGSTVIHGPSGAGKTTLLMTMAGLVPAISGTVRGSAGAAFTAEDAHVFHTTVLENLRVARGDVTEDEALRALDLTGLRPWLAAQPDGLATMIGPDASTISGGERRRLLIARALLNRSPILLIDEPAEHLDSAGVAALLADLLTLPRRTADEEFPVSAVVIASHHEPAPGLADQVIELGEVYHQATD